MERWRDGEMERWRDGEMERWRDGEIPPPLPEVLGFVVYLPGYGKKIVSLGFSMNTSKEAETAVYVIHKLLKLIASDPELAPFFKRVTRLRIWADCGMHFRAHVFAHYALVEIYKHFPHITSAELGYFLEDHGKGEHDALYAAMQGWIRRGAGKDRVATMEEAMQAATAGHAVAQLHKGRWKQDASHLLMFDYGDIRDGGLTFQRLEIPEIQTTYSVTSQRVGERVDIMNRGMPDVPFGHGVNIPESKIKPSKKSTDELAPKWAQVVEDQPAVKYDSVRTKQDKVDKLLRLGGGRLSAPRVRFLDDHFTDLLDRAKVPLPMNLKDRKVRADIMAREAGRMVGYHSDGAGTYRFAVCRGEVEDDGKEIWLEYEDANGTATIATPVHLLVANACRKTHGLVFLEHPDGKRFSFEGGEDGWVQCTACKAWRLGAEVGDVNPLDWVCPLGCNVFRLTAEELQSHPTGMPRRGKRAPKT